MSYSLSPLDYSIVFTELNNILEYHCFILCLFRRFFLALFVELRMLDKQIKYVVSKKQTLRVTLSELIQLNF